MHLGLATPLDIDALRAHLHPQPAGAVWPAGLGASAITPLVEGLLAAGHRVSVYTLDPHVRTPVVLPGPRLTVFVGPWRPRARHRCLDLFAQEARHLAAFIAQDQPELVHAHWGYEFALGALRSGAPHLITLHDDPWKILRYQPDAYRVVRLLLKLLVLRRGQHFTAVSPYLAAALARGARRPAVVPNALCPAPGGPRQLPAAGPLRVVSLLTEWSGLKNAATALLAFRQLRARLGPRAEYWLFGSAYAPGGPAHRWALAHDAAAGVQFMGSVPHRELLARLPTFDVLLHPSREESFGMTLVEAMQAGLPVVGGHRAGAVPWVLEEGRCGVLTDVDSPAAMARDLLDLLTDPARYAGLSIRGLAMVQARFSVAAVVAAYEGHYRRVLAQPPTQARPASPVSAARIPTPATV